MHYITPHYTTFHFTTLYYTTLHSTTLHYATLHYNYATLHSTTLHYTPLHSTTLNYTTLQLQLQQLQLHYTNCITLHYTTLHNTLNSTTLNYTTLHYPTPHCITLHYITLHSLHHHKCNCNYTTLITLRHNYNSTTLQLQLHYTTLHPAVVGEVTDQVTTATIAATPKKHSSNHLSVHQWIRFAIRDSQEPISPIGFLFLKLPPPPCAVLLVLPTDAVCCPDINIENVVLSNI